MTQKEMLANIAAMLAQTAQASNPKATVPAWVAEAQKVAEPAKPRELAPVILAGVQNIPFGTEGKTFRAVVIHNGKERRNYRDVKLDSRYLKAVVQFLQTDDGKAFLKSGTL